jgi:hypothetical protein
MFVRFSEERAHTPTPWVSVQDGQYFHDSEVHEVEPGTLDKRGFPIHTGNSHVHAAHCCALHGCKYGATDCPVAAGTLAPLHGGNNGCEQCEFDQEEGA